MTLGFRWFLRTLSSAAPQSGLPLLRFQPPPLRTQRADFPHYALLHTSPQGLWDLSRWGRFGRSLARDAVLAEETEFLVQPSPTPPLPAEALTLEAPRRFSLRLDVYPASQFLQIDGCLYHFTPASRVDDGIVCSRAPLLRGRYPASSLLRTQPPPSRLRPTSRGRRLYGLPCSADFAAGRGRLLQLLGMSLSPCCLYHPAGAMRRISQIATRRSAFASWQMARPPDFVSDEATYEFTCVAAR